MRPVEDKFQKIDEARAGTESAGELNKRFGNLRVRSLEVVPQMIVNDWPGPEGEDRVLLELQVQSTRESKAGAAKTELSLGVRQAHELFLVLQQQESQSERRVAQQESVKRNEQQEKASVYNRLAAFFGLSSWGNKTEAEPQDLTNPFAPPGGRVTRPPARAEAEQAPVTSGELAQLVDQIGMLVARGSIQAVPRQGRDGKEYVLAVMAESTKRLANDPSAEAFVDFALTPEQVHELASKLRRVLRSTPSASFRKIA